MTDPPEQDIWGWPCIFHCGRTVAVKGRACWPCQSYEDYLTAPRCECPHDTVFFCSCSPSCEEDCPAAVAAFDRWSQSDAPDDGEEPVKGPQGGA